MALSLRYAYAWKFSLGIPICSYNSVVVPAPIFRIKACNCQSTPTSITVFQNPWWLCILQELHTRESYCPLSSMYANDWQMSQQAPFSLITLCPTPFPKMNIYWIQKHEVKDICLEFWEFFSHFFIHHKCPCCQGQCVSGEDFATHCLQIPFLQTLHIFL